MTRQARVHRLPADSPDDVAGLARCFADGSIDANAVVAIFGKTEGNGCVNDWTRALATRALMDCLRDHAGPAVAEAACLIMSGGTEGGLAPHWLVFESTVAGAPSVAGALAIGTARTPPLEGEHLGRRGQVAAVAAGVRQAMAAAGLENPASVHLVQVKCPLLTSDRIGAVRARGGSVATTDTLKSLGLSRGASALGVAVALDELDIDAISDDAIARDPRLVCTRASASAGVELLGHEIVVLGAAPAGWSGPLRIDHAVMDDAIDIEPVRAALGRLGLPANGQLTAAQRVHLVGVIAKAEASMTGRIRASRHTMLIDSDLASTRHARGFVGGALAGLTGLTELFVSGGAEHQGPDGGGPVAIIATAPDQETGS